MGNHYLAAEGCQVYCRSPSETIHIEQQFKLHLQGCPEPHTHVFTLQLEKKKYYCLQLRDFYSSNVDGPKLQIWLIRDTASGFEF